MSRLPVAHWRSRLAMLILLIALLVLQACTRPARIQADLGQEFLLSVGQTVAIRGENFEVKFDRVVTDSRCPRDVKCVWAGEVRCLIAITVTNPPAPPYNLELTQMGLTGQVVTQDFVQYKLIFDVQPYPVAGRAIAEGDYRLVMKVER